MRDGRVAPLPDAQKRAHAELFHVLDVENFDVNAELFERFCLLREFDGPQNVGWLVDQIAGNVDAVGDGLQRLKCSLGLVGMGDVDDQLFQAVLFGGGFVAVFLV